MSRSVSGTTAPTSCSLAQLAQRRDVAGIVDPRTARAVVRGVLRRRERVRVGRDDGRVLGERRDDVVALADAGQQDRLRRSAAIRPVSPL